MNWNKKYDALVLSSGGVNGFAMLGCIQKLVDNDCLKDITIYVGTSVGAMIAYLLCIGYSPTEIFLGIWQENVMEQLQHSCQIMNLIQNKGIVDWEICRRFLKKLTFKKIHREDLTLLELKERYQKELICCTYNFSQKRVEFINYQKEPHLNCIDALRMTSNIPIIFDTFQYKGDYYIDGAVYCNFPIHYMDIKQYNVLGIKIDHKNVKDLQDINIFYNYLYYLYYLLYIPSYHLYEFLNHQHELDCDIILVDSNGNNTINFFMKINEAMELFSIGYKSC